MMTTPTQHLPAWIKPALGDNEDLRPPGQNESDWELVRRPTLPIFEPEIHVGPSRPSDIGDLFGPLVRDGTTDSGTIVPVEGESTDRLAWYRSYRYGNAWGIYIREAAVVSLAQLLSSQRRPPGPDSERVAWSVLYLHEYSHFLFDIAADALEQAVGTDLYEPYRLEIRGTPPGWHLEAEAVCNAFAYRTAPAKGYRQGLRSFMRHQPAGYRDFNRYVSDEAFDAGVEAVFGHVLRGLKGRAGVGLRALYDDGDGARVAPAMVPLYVVHEPEEKPVFRLITCLSSIETSKAFDKELQTLPLAVQQSWAERVRPALQADVRTAGNFKKLQASRDLYSVRVHGTYRAILRREGDERWTVLSIGHRREVYG